MKSTRVTPGMGKGFLPPLKKNALAQSTTPSQSSAVSISPENMYWPPYNFTTGEYINTKDTWKSMTTSTGAQVMINYGVNGKDVVSTSMVIAQFNIHGLKATKLGLKATFGDVYVLQQNWYGDD
ncbi:hypothetical protein [Vibrio ostreicida]|uniref:hypothetical protein n=1 Tax=Vibrio ostreicida TaxID=526588 RepID=UPI001FE36C1D|nr:hypothetical protein [Vibrio ostreicida]